MLVFNTIIVNRINAWGAMIDFALPMTRQLIEFEKSALNTGKSNRT